MIDEVHRTKIGLANLIIVILGVILSGLSCDVGAESLPANYWELPVPIQGPAPTDWAALERSLHPKDCGVCHADQYAQWRTSFHAQALSPGLVGQLLNMSATNAAACLSCHAPLVEQRHAFESVINRTGVQQPVTSGLAAAGIVCATCHVRRHRRFGPPKKDTGEIGRSDGARPHGGVVRSAEFEQSSFCSACHQFPAAAAINGKPLENTYAEWRESPAAHDGKTCQTCHMPERKHLWRGIHDPAMVMSGVTADHVATADTARFRLTNTGVGHAFPTYVTPKVLLKGAALNADDDVIADTEMSVVIQRRVEFTDGAWVERFDTRLLPGESTTLEMAWPASGRVQFWLEVHPDDFYDHDVFDSLLARLAEDSAAAALIAEADRRAQTNRFRLLETVLERP